MNARPFQVSATKRVGNKFSSMTSSRHAGCPITCHRIVTIVVSSSVLCIENTIAGMGVVVCYVVSQKLRRVGFHTTDFVAIAQKVQELF